MIRVKQSKGGTDRSPLLSPHLLAALRASCQLDRPLRRLFPGQILTQSIPISSDFQADCTSLPHRTLMTLLTKRLALTLHHDKARGTRVTKAGRLAEQRANGALSVRCRAS
jgi:hypothetical protein